MRKSMLRPSLALGLAVAVSGAAAQSSRPVYRCPGPPVLYTDAISAAEADKRGCRTIEAAPITIIQGPRPAAPATKPGAAPGPGAAASRPADQRVSPADQRSRDSDARRILEAELKREEEKLGALQREFNNGEPERRGDERNYQRYVDRVEEMKAGIARKESDIAAIKRELAKLPAAAP
jgi:hypothetical protein